MAGENNSTTVDRRSFLASSAAGAAVVTAAPSVLAGGNAGRLIGAKLTHGYSVVAIEGGAAGAVKVILDHQGQNLHVLVCQYQPGSGAMASTGVVDLFLMNNGRDGEVKTPDNAVKAVEALAKSLKGHEPSLPGFKTLLGQQERLQQFDPIDHADPLAP